MNSHLENIVTNTCLCLPWCSWQSLPIQSSWVPHEEDMCTAALIQGPPQRMHHMQSPGNKAWMLYFYDVNKCSQYLAQCSTELTAISTYSDLLFRSLSVIWLILNSSFLCNKNYFHIMYNKLGSQTLEPISTICPNSSPMHNQAF